MELLAKSNGETLYQHSIFVYTCGMAIIDMLPFNRIEREAIKAVLKIPLLLHDIGKAAEGFQISLINNRNWAGRRHEILSAYFLKSLGLDDDQIFSVITHHKEINNISQENTLPIEQTVINENHFKEMKDSFDRNKDALFELCDRLFNFIGMKFHPDICKKVDSIINREWIEEGFHYQQSKCIPLEKRRLASVYRGIIKAADHIASAGVYPVSQVELKIISITEYELRHFQKKCKETVGSIILIAPTGSGKTEAALLWAQTNQDENSRIFYILPYQASINAMHIRLKEIFGDNKTGMLHANTVSALYHMQGETQDKLDGQKKAVIKASLAKEIYYPVRVCTPHQLLRMGLRGSGWEYLFIEFAKAVFIYDEVHAYQPLIAGLTIASARLAQKLGARCCFISATFPSFLQDIIKKELNISYTITLDEEYSSDRRIINKKRHIVEIKKGTLLDNIELIESNIEEGKYVLIIANHVSSAQKLFQTLSFYNPILLHSRFNKKDRRDREKALLSDNKPRVVIATQVIEVSLDIDYDIMFSEPAPIDALIQRFGRVFRKRTIIDEQTNIYIMDAQISTNNLYKKERVEKTIQELSERQGRPMGEKVLLIITNKVYENGYEPDEQEQFEKGLYNENIMNFQDNIIAGLSRKWIDDFLEKEGNCLVLPNEMRMEFEDFIKKGQWVEANDLLVSVRYSIVKDSIRDSMNDIYIVNCEYSSELGLLPKQKESNFIGLD